MKAIRWSDNDKYAGPFTFSRDTYYKSTAVLLGSGDGDEYAGCRLRMSAFGVTLIVALPQIIKPWRKWVDTSKYDWSTNPNGGYWDTGEREYGFSLSEGFLNLSLGRVTDDSSTEQRKGYFLPWTEWRCSARRFYDDKGNLAFTDTSSGPQPIGPWISSFPAKQVSAKGLGKVAHWATAFLWSPANCMKARSGVTAKKTT